MQFGLNANQLKIIAAISMLLDHLGYQAFSEEPIFRILGRFAFPIFAYFIAEGCRYTKHRVQYVARLLVVGIICVIGYYVFCQEVYFNIMITFSFSICLIYLIQWWKKAVREKVSWMRLMPMTLLVAACFAAVYLITRIIIRSCELDYGSLGILTPVYIEFLDWNPKYSKLTRAAGLTLGLITLGLRIGGNQWLSLLAIPLILAYNGKRGKWNMKYFFYIFYPLHFLLVQGIAMCVGV